MKLELKDINCYLPYGLKIFVESDGFLQNDETFEVNAITQNGVNVTIKTFPFNTDYSFDEFKIILHPLSDLNRFGEDIINEHSINLLISEKYNLDYGVFIYYDGEMDIELDGDPDLRYDTNKRISFDVMLTIQEELLKGHYDIYVLIENNLAIDINTLKL